ncbi:MAG TPA: 30S ribosomal protein S2 [Candidatus Levybacteria bacterium]|nr:30S ribosomal protein S2 [Candidatus Levybacteria bacterium]
MREITLEELLEAGCHFGHQVNRNNPKANEFIFEARNNVHIINLEQTRDGLIESAQYIRDLAAKGGTIIVVGTKRQVQPVIKEEVTRARENGAENLHFVASRWIGGVLTNFAEVSKNFKKLKEIEEILSDKNSGYTKREKLLMEREKVKLMSLYEGIRDLKKIPDALFVVDTHYEATAVAEARRRNLPVVGMVDTNADPTIIDYVIPSNDDAVGAVKLITSYVIDAWIEGQKEAATIAAKEKAAEEKKAQKKTDAEKKINAVQENTDKKPAVKKEEKKSTTKSKK